MILSHSLPLLHLSMESGKTALLTVGSTEFTSLVSSALSKQVLQALVDKGYTRFIVQYGKSKLPSFKKGENGSLVDVEMHDFMKDIEERMREVELVICHAGAGSILAALRGPALNPLAPSAKKVLIIVPNDTLMDSHQSDLADELGRKGWARVASDDTSHLAQTIRDLPEIDADTTTTSRTVTRSQALPAFDGTRIQSILDEQMRFM